MDRNPSAIQRLLAVMAQLRDPQTGCPWDLEQSFASIAPYTIEEAYEVADAIEQGDMQHLRDELGDLLLQVVFHAQIAKDAGLFDFNDVATGIADKMIRRHPHVFGDQKVAGADAQTPNWEAQKAAERDAEAAAAGRVASALDGVSLALPALLRAIKLQKRAARVGFDWPELAPVIAKIEEELTELKTEIAAATVKPEAIEDEMGDLLFACVNLARHLRRRRRVRGARGVRVVQIHHPLTPAQPSHASGNLGGQKEDPVAEGHRPHRDAHLVQIRQHLQLVVLHPPRPGLVQAAPNARPRVLQNVLPPTRRAREPATLLDGFQQRLAQRPRVPRHTHARIQRFHRSQKGVVSAVAVGRGRMHRVSGRVEGTKLHVHRAAL